MIREVINQNFDKYNEQSKNIRHNKHKIISI